MQYFGMFCEQARARQTGKNYMLEMLLPEVRDTAERLRARIMDTRRVPPVPLSALKSTLLARPRSEPLNVGPQVQLQRPGTPRLSM
jgi:hypothetical protein